MSSQSAPPTYAALPRLLTRPYPPHRNPLVIRHPLFPHLEEGARWMVLYLFLDEALGEIGTGNWIGKSEMNDSHLGEAIPLTELRSYAEQVFAGHGWKRGEPCEIWSVYKMNGDNLARPRGDIYVGTTCHMDLIREYDAARDGMEDPLKETGADHVFVQFEIGFLLPGGGANARGEIEEALTAALEPASGRLLGGAMGGRFAYIDLLLFDGERSQRLVLETLRRQRLAEGHSAELVRARKARASGAALAAPTPSPPAPAPRDP